MDRESSLDQMIDSLLNTRVDIDTPEEFSPLQQYVRALFEYRDGALYWRVTKGKRRVAGTRVGWLSDRGYRRVGLDGRSMRAARLVWIWHYGDIPEGLQIDHINRIRDDDRIENLRTATPTENSQNKEDRKADRKFREYGKALDLFFEHRVQANTSK